MNDSLPEVAPKLALPAGGVLLLVAFVGIVTESPVLVFGGVIAALLCASVFFRRRTEPRTFEGEVRHLVSRGFRVVERTDTTASLVRPKRFSFVWAFLWFLVFGIGVLVYIFYFMAKGDDYRYVEAGGAPEEVEEPEVMAL